jgi:dienelactone hydrolase
MLPAFEALETTRAMTMRDIAGQITCPVLVCEAEEDQFFKGQPEKLVKALGKKATYIKFTTEGGAGNHCHVGASVRMNQIVMGWVKDVLDGRHTAEAMVV